MLHQEVSVEVVPLEYLAEFKTLICKPFYVKLIQIWEGEISLFVLSKLWLCIECWFQIDISFTLTCIVFKSVHAGT